MDERLKVKSYSSLVDLGSNSSVHNMTSLETPPPLISIYIKDEIVVIVSFSSIFPSSVNPYTINARMYRYGVVVSG